MPNTVGKSKLPSNFLKAYSQDVFCESRFAQFTKPARPLGSLHLPAQRAAPSKLRPGVSRAAAIPYGHPLVTLGRCGCSSQFNHRSPIGFQKLISAPARLFSLLPY